MKISPLVNRRSLIGGGAALAAAVNSNQTIAQSSGAQDMIFGTVDVLQFQPDKDVKSIEDYYDDWVSFTGKEDAYQEEIVEAEKILEKAPRGRTPFDIALYFYDLRAGIFGDLLAKYGHEWPVRYNPVIVKFFEKTQIRKPVGDTTAWCSAFMNWCVDRSRIDRPDREILNSNQLTKPSGNAAALSWKNFGSATDTPQIGDIVVFGRTDAEGKSKGQGHVAFFLQRSGDRITILGGNQSPPYNAVKNGGEVNAKVVSVGAGSIFELVGYRTDPSIL